MSLSLLISLLTWSHLVCITGAQGGFFQDNGLGNVSISNHQQPSVSKFSQSRYRTDIPVNIQIKPANFLHGKNYIPTNASITAIAEILDDKFKNASIEFQWSVKDKTITTNKNASQIEYKFNKAESDNFLEVLVVDKPNNTGKSRKSLVIRDPIVVQQPIGKLFLEHGELLDISLNISGTGPFSYCLEFCSQRQALRECSECTPDHTLHNNKVTILKYLHKVGNYTLLFVVDNVASRVKKNYSVRITDTVRPKTIPYVPIVSSVLAVIIILSGITLHMKFKQTYVTETADFDFIRQDYNEPDDFWDEEHTFWQRVKYSLFRSSRDPNTSQSDSFLSVT